MKLQKFTEFDRTDHAGKLLNAYLVIEDCSAASDNGGVLGMVWQIESRHPHLAGRIEIGCSYSKGWGRAQVVNKSFPRIGDETRRYPPLPKRTRAQAVAALLAMSEGPF